MLERVEEIKHESTRSSNRCGVLLGNKACSQTKTLTHVLWSLLNSIPRKACSDRDRHNSVALDLAVAAKPGVYTLMGKEIDKDGFIIDPIRCDWIPGGVSSLRRAGGTRTTTRATSVAWVLPMQDAGLYTHQRTLDIRFVDDEITLHAEGKIRGSAFAVTNKQYLELSHVGGSVPNPKGQGMKRVLSVECMSGEVNPSELRRPKLGRAFPLRRRNEKRSIKFIQSLAAARRSLALSHFSRDSDDNM